MKKRLNVRLVVRLVLGTIVVGVAVGLLHMFQVRREAGALRDHAEKAREDGQLDEAREFYRRYLGYIPSDNEARAELSLILCDIAEEPNASNREIISALERMEGVLQRDPSAAEVRKRLAHLESRVGRFSDAKEHAEYLLKHSPNDAELYLLKGRCQMVMAEYEMARSDFRKAIDLDKSQIEAYRMLIALIQRESDDWSDEVEQVLDEMIEANPESHHAQLLKVTVKAIAKEEEETAKALARAIEISPDDTDVLYHAGIHAVRNEQFDQAREHLLHAVELYPEDARFYQMLAMVERFDEQLPKAIEFLNQGLEALPENLDLLSRLAELQLESRDVAAAESTIEKLAELKVIPEALDFLEARVRGGEGRWEEARSILERLRPRMVRNERFSKNVNLLLGECYGRLRQPELQIEAFRRALALNPNPLEAKKAYMGIAAGNQMLGRQGDARRALSQAAGDGDLKVMLQIMAMDMRRIIAQPKEDRNWVLMERMFEQYEQALNEDTPPEIRAQLKAYQAEVLFQKDDQDGAIEFLAAQRAQHPKISMYWLTEAQFEARRQQFEQAHALLDEAESRFPDDRLRIVLTRAGVYQSAGDERAREQLETLARSAGDFTEEEQLALLRSVTVVFRALGDANKAREVNRLILDIRKDDERAHFVEFELALSSNDEPAAQEAIDAIETALGSDSFAWHFAKGVYLITVARQREDEQDDLLAEGQKHVNQAERLRSGIPQLIGLLAEIEDIRGNADDAIEGYLRAIDQGATQIRHFRRLASLLVQQGRWEEFLQLGQRMPTMIEKTGLSDLQIYAVQKTQGDEAAEKFAQQAYDEDSTDFRTHLLYGSVMARRGHLDDAERALRRAVEVGSDQTTTWLALVNFLAGMRKVNEAKAAMERAAEALPEDMAMLTLARCHEILGDKTTAERIYLQTLGARRDDLVVIANVADYFNRSMQPEQARKYMQEVLEIGSQDPGKNGPVMAAARRGIADLSSRGGTYQDHLEALKLIDRNTRSDGALGPEDTWIKGQILARRGDGESRRQAIRIIEDLLKLRSSNAKARLVLAQLYTSDREYTKARDHLTRLCVEIPRNAKYKAMLINVLLSSGLIGEAESWLQTLEQQNPGAVETLDAKARVRVKQGRIDEAIEALKSLVPPPPIPADKLPLLLQVASTLNDLAPLAQSDEHRRQIVEDGHEVLRRYVNAYPRGVLAMADFLSRNGELDQALEHCQQGLEVGFPVEHVASVAVSAIRNALANAGPSHFQLVEEWLLPAIEKRPDSADLLVQMAELQDMKGDYDASEQYYRRVLPLSDVNHLRRAQALNNLSFLLAIRTKNPDEALRMVEEAIKLAGPISDMLDTRAVVLLAGGAVESAISDLQQAVKDGPSGMKYFHLAHAYLLAKNRKAAADALNKAHQEGLTDEEVSPLERANYRKLLDAVGERSANRPARFPASNRPFRAAS